MQLTNWAMGLTATIIFGMGMFVDPAQAATAPNDASALEVQAPPSDIEPPSVDEYALECSEPSELDAEAAGMVCTPIYCSRYPAVCILAGCPGY